MLISFVMVQSHCTLCVQYTCSLAFEMVVLKAWTGSATTQSDAVMKATLVRRDGNKMAIRWNQCMTMNRFVILR